jgi:hypothetical protein
MKKTKLKSIKNGKQISKKEKLPSKFFQKDKWLEYDKFVKQEMEDMYLTMKNAGAC